MPRTRRNLKDDKHAFRGPRIPGNNWMYFENDPYLANDNICHPEYGVPFLPCLWVSAFSRFAPHYFTRTLFHNRLQFASKNKRKTQRSTTQSTFSLAYWANGLPFSLTLTPLWGLDFVFQFSGRCNKNVSRETPIFLPESFPLLDLQRLTFVLARLRDFDLWRIIK